MAEEIPVYLFTGFMDSGKTSLIKDTIFENDFANGSKGLIIMCEDGDVEYDMDKLKAANIQVAEIDSEDEFTAAKLNFLTTSLKSSAVKLKEVVISYGFTKSTLANVVVVFSSTTPAKLAPAFK